MNKVLLITHPVDLGNAAYARNFIAASSFSDDLDHASFAVGDLVANRGGAMVPMSTLLRRVSSGFALRHAFSRARKEERAVIIQGLSAALFTLPYRRGLRTFVILDWTRKLFEPIFGSSRSSPWLTSLHRRTMLSTQGLLCLTDAVRQSLRRDYGIPERLLFRIRAPFQVDACGVSATLGSPIRLLFVGGNFQRKGGDVLLDWYASRPRPDVALTVVTQSDIVAPQGVKVRKNDAARGFDDYANFDILVLPTRLDTYPQVIGEAASAGLAIATTANALGAPDIVVSGHNGFIANSVVEFRRLLDELVSSPPLVEAYKANSRKKMLAEATAEACWRTIGRIVFG